MKSIAWLPAHPAMGWASMNRCWQAMQRQAVASPPPDLSFVCPLKPTPVEQLQAPAWKRHWARYLGYPFRVKLLRGVDAVHVLDHSFAELLRWVKPGVKKVVTVHDVIPLLDPADMTVSQVQRFRSRLAWLHQADVVLCVSEFTKQCLIQELNMEPAKLRLLPNGVDLPTSPAKPCAIEAPRPWLLLVGTNAERKNLRLVPEVLRHLQLRGIWPSIVRVGPTLKPAIHAKIRSIIGDDHLVNLGRVSDESLASAYTSADLLFLPSTLEGFGLPVIEAMAHGCPVVCARSSSLPEIAGDAALFFDPANAEEAASQCATALTNPVERQRLMTAGRARAKACTWSQHWSQLCEAYREVLAA